MEGQSTKVNSGLGDLGKLPIELRLDIFSRLLPADFKQIYRVTESGFVYSPFESYPKPIFLKTSRQLHAEMFAAAKMDNRRNVTIALDTITTDFFGNFSVLMSNEITACKLLEITIVRPSPRSAIGFAKLRSNVQELVDVLNRSTCQILPKLTIRLESSHPQQRGSCGYNDFAMLMGPFSRLLKPCRAVMLYRTTGSMLFSPKIERQCNLLEQAMLCGGQSAYNQQPTPCTGKRTFSSRDCVNSSSEIHILQYQQYMLEIRLPFALLLCVTPQDADVDQKEAVYFKSRRRILEACRGLKEWCCEHKASQPSWLDAALNQALKDGLPMHALQEKIVGSSNMDPKNWAAGHLQAHNPFWDEKTMS